MPSVTINAIETDGPIRITFGKRTYEFASIEHMRDVIRSRMDDVSIEMLDMLSMAMMLRRQPNLGNPGVFIGRTNTLDLTQTNWGRVS